MGDEVIDRVAKRVPELRETYVGEPVRYFHGVGRYLVLEHGRKKETATDELPVRLPEIDRHSDEYECLLKCLKFLAQDKRELILDYYLYQGHEKIEHHRDMAKELGITDGALRGRAFQVRSRLEKCISDCIPTVNKTKNASRDINTGVQI
ncbi:MAG TPA: hypothetical protein VFY60_09360 [Pyrinomonadaceae bacterium]|nr:hypothetical protein [Pyrinomonadaceae bacterium]